MTAMRGMRKNAAFLHMNLTGPRSGAENRLSRSCRPSQERWNAHLRRWIHRARPEEEARRLSRDGEARREGVARAWRPRIPRVPRRGREGREAHLVSAQREAQAR